MFTEADKQQVFLTGLGAILFNFTSKVYTDKEAHEALVKRRLSLTFSKIRYKAYENKAKLGSWSSC